MLLQTHSFTSKHIAEALVNANKRKDGPKLGLTVVMLSGAVLRIRMFWYDGPASIIVWIAEAAPGIATGVPGDNETEPMAA